VVAVALVQRMVVLVGIPHLALSLLVVVLAVKLAVAGQLAVVVARQAEQM
jgi:hypothetical protein